MILDAYTIYSMCANKAVLTKSLSNTRKCSDLG